MIHLKNTSTNRLKAAASDLSDISMENLSEYGKKQLDERIRKIVSETNTQ